MMNKFYLLPISLLLLNSGFAEDVENNPIPSELGLIFVEKVDSEKETEIASADLPPLEVDPALIKKLEEEIALMIEPETLQPAEQEVASAILEPAIEKEAQEIASSEEIDSPNKTNPEIAYLKHKSRKTKPIVQANCKEPTVQELKPQENPLLEKEPGSHVRRFSTSSANIKTFKKNAPTLLNPIALSSEKINRNSEIAHSDYLRPISKNYTLKVKEQSKATLAQSEIAEQKISSDQTTTLKKDTLQSKQIAPVKSRAVVQKSKTTLEKTPSSLTKPKVATPHQLPKSKQVAPVQSRSLVQKTPSSTKNTLQSQTAQGNASPKNSGVVEAQTLQKKQLVQGQQLPESANLQTPSRNSGLNPSGSQSKLVSPRQGQQPLKQSTQPQRTTPSAMPRAKTPVPQGRQLIPSDRQRSSKPKRCASKLPRKNNVLQKSCRLKKSPPSHRIITFQRRHSEKAPLLPKTLKSQHKQHLLFLKSKSIKIN